MIARLWLGEARRLPRALAPPLALLLLLRRGAQRLAHRRASAPLLLALWGLLDRRLSQPTRAQLLLAPVAYALLWCGVTAWAHSDQQVFGGEAQLHKADISSSRFGIWANTLALIAAHPWVGVGFGEFNFAWTLTPFPGRPVAFFDHTHNLPLHLAVELGLPLAALVLALLLWALWRRLALACVSAPTADEPCRDAPRRAGDGADGAAAQPAGVPAVVRLLPAAGGVCVRAVPRRARAGRLPTPSQSAPQRHATAGARGDADDGSAALVSVQDYLRVVVIFAPPENAAPLAQRIAEGQRSWFFAPPCRLRGGHHGRAPVAGDGRPSRARRTTCWTRA